MTQMTMTDMLDFEREWWRYAGDRPAAIRARFDLDPDVYHRALDQVIATDVAVEHDPMLVKRLRRLSAQRRRSAS